MCLLKFQNKGLSYFHNNISKWSILFNPLPPNLKNVRRKNNIAEKIQISLDFEKTFCLFVCTLNPFETDHSPPGSEQDRWKHWRELWRGKTFFSKIFVEVSVVTQLTSDWFSNSRIFMFKSVLMRVISPRFTYMQNDNPAGVNFTYILYAALRLLKAAFTPAGLCHLVGACHTQSMS